MPNRPVNELSGAPQSPRIRGALAYGALAGLFGVGCIGLVSLCGEGLKKLGFISAPPEQTARYDGPAPKGRILEPGRYDKMVIGHQIPSGSRPMHETKPRLGARPIAEVGHPQHNIKWAASIAGLPISLAANNDRLTRN